MAPLNGPDGLGGVLSGRPPLRWLVTGAAGFIGSNLLETLLSNGQHVVAIDNFATGHRHNLEDVRQAVGPEAWARLSFREADICDAPACDDAMQGVDIVLHQAALGSVPRSIADPISTLRANATGFATVLDAARRAGVQRFVYASSSSVYGDHPALPKVEDRTGRVLSPYAATKAMDEILAEAFARTYDLSCIGLRYFNVFGPRQDPEGAYAAVIPRWTASMLRGEPVWINGDGQTSRDFCHVANAVQANLRAGMAEDLPSPHEVFNVAVGQRTTLLELFQSIREGLQACTGRTFDPTPQFRAFRAGDVRHSLADVSKAHRLLGYVPTHDLGAGIRASMGWYVTRAGSR